MQRLLNNSIKEEREEVRERTPLSQLLDLDIRKPAKGSGYHLLLPSEDEEGEVSFTYNTDLDDLNIKLKDIRI